MKDTVKKITDIVLGNPSIVAIIGDSFNPVIAPIDEDLPSCQYSLSKKPSNTGVTLVTTQKDVYLNITSVSKSYLQCWELDKLFEQAFKNQHGFEYLGGDDNYSVDLDGFAVISTFKIKNITC